MDSCWETESQSSSVGDPMCINPPKAGPMPRTAGQHKVDCGCLCVLFFLVCVCFLGKNMKLGGQGGEIWEELVRGKNMTKIYYMKN